MKFQNPSMHGSQDMVCIKKRDEWTHRWMDNPKRICSVNFFEVGGIIRWWAGSTLFVVKENLHDF